MSRSRTRVRRGDDEGVVLLFVLAFVLVIAVIVGALLNQSYVNFRAARVAADVDRRLYAANGGIDWGIQQLRSGRLLAGSPACVNQAQGVQTLTVDPLVLNERTVTVTCQVLSGTTAPPDNWSVYVTGSGGIRTWPTDTNEKPVAGAVYNAGAFTFGPGTSLRVNNGRVLQLQASCPGSIPAGLSLFPSPPYTWTCGSAPALPSAGVRFDRLPNYYDVPTIEDPLGDTPVGAPNCRRFAPGRHTSPPQFLPSSAGVNYLRRGVYFFDNVGVIDINDATVLGGAPAPGETTLTGALAAATNVGCPVQSGTDPDGNYGVVLVLGGNSTLRIRGQSLVELHGWFDPVGGTDGALSILQLPASVDAAKASMVVGPNATLVQTVHGSRSQLVVHGSVHVPSARFSLFGTTEASVSLLRGVVAAGLDLQARPGPTGVIAAAPIAAGSRTIRLEATTNSGDGEKSARAIADVEVIDGAGSAITVTSWSVAQ